MSWHRLVWSVFFFLLTGCGVAPEKPPGPLEPDRGTKGYYCGMALSEHAGPKGQIHVAGEAGALWFSSVKDAFAYLHNEGATRRILAFYVNDMGWADWERPQPGSWIQAKEAVFLLDSRKSGGMGMAEIIPFAKPSIAKEWVGRHGGRILSYEDVLKENF